MKSITTLSLINAKPYIGFSLYFPDLLFLFKASQPNFLEMFFGVKISCIYPISTCIENNKPSLPHDAIQVIQAIGISSISIHQLVCIDSHK